ncbi:MAG: LysM peptidoglycan-binding domain-containing protein [Mycobacterium sp.]
MTVLDDRQVMDRQLLEWQQVWPREAVRASRSVERPAPSRSVTVRRGRPTSGRAGRPNPMGPAIAPMRYSGTGIAMSRTAHLPRRRVSTSVTIALAAMAALITVWLGSIAQFSSDRVAAAAVVPEQLAVVQVQAGETLAQLATRLAPDAPSGQMVERIRDLNNLGSVSVDAGQTLIAPVG